MCPLGRYSRNLQTTIIPFPCNVSSHKTVWILSCSVFLFIMQDKHSNICSWRRMSMPLGYLYKCKQVACSVVVACFVYPIFFCTALYCCLFTSLSLFIYTDVVAILLFIRWSYKQVQYFCFLAPLFIICSDLFPLWC